MNLNDWHESGNYFDYQRFPIFYRKSETVGRNFASVCTVFRLLRTIIIKSGTRLAEKFSVLAFDMIGYGFSAKPPILITRLLIRLMFCKR